MRKRRSPIFLCNISIAFVLILLSAGFAQVAFSDTLTDLQANLSNLRGQSATLEAQIADTQNPAPGGKTKAELQSELAGVKADIVAVQNQIDSLPPPSKPDYALAAPNPAGVTLTAGGQGSVSLALSTSVPPPASVTLSIGSVSGPSGGQVNGTISSATLSLSGVTVTLPSPSSFTPPASGPQAVPIAVSTLITATPGVYSVVIQGSASAANSAGHAVTFTITVAAPLSPAPALSSATSNICTTGTVSFTVTPATDSSPTGYKLYVNQKADSSFQVAASATGGAQTFSWTDPVVGGMETYQVSALYPWGESSRTALKTVLTPSACSCSPSPTTVTANRDQVTWSAHVVPDSSYTYAWGGNDGPSGSTKTVSTVYRSQGTKTASVTFTDPSNQRQTVSCAPAVTVNPETLGTGTNQQGTVSAGAGANPIVSGGLSISGGSGAPPPVTGGVTNNQTTLGNGALITVGNNQNTANTPTPSSPSAGGDTQLKLSSDTTNGNGSLTPTVPLPPSPSAGGDTQLKLSSDATNGNGSLTPTVPLPPSTSAGGNTPLRSDLSSTGGGLVPACPATGCGFNELMKLVDNIVKYLIVLGVAISVFSFAYSGFMLIIGGAGESEKITKAKEVLSKAVIGTLLMLGAYLIIKTIEGALVSSANGFHLFF